eukprot:TRINITY_DN12872_c1_g1_i1.p1 TRINITY_DN12872_c1_g1~~TRINITY_DN12872_c1_g1_i1.p1  ORF type:complete len:129 (-),score=42.60 TRINITY_DN12872_c1_g1_i1:84-428(-)
MAQGGQAGIQQLLKAEQQAQEIVSKARREKTALMKRARDEAEGEVQQYRTQRQNEYTNSIAQDTGSADQYTVKVDQETSVKINAIRQVYDQRKGVVVKSLLTSVSDVKVAEAKV